MKFPVELACLLLTIKYVSGKAGKKAPSKKSYPSNPQTSVTEIKEEPLDEDEYYPTPTTSKHVCEVCDKELSSQGSLSTHRLTHGEKQFQCNACEKLFTTFQGLQTHSRIHTGEQPFACSFCDKTFAFRKSWKCHEMIHTNLKPHVCPNCKKAFRQKTHLQYHLRTHSGEKPHRCHICNKAFSYSGSLRNHLSSHS